MASTDFRGSYASLRSKSTRDSPTYFRSPILTILESLENGRTHICSHDLIHAYDVFSTRVKGLSSEVLAKDDTVPALDFLRQHSHALAQCLKRDIAGIHVDPFPVAPRSINQIPDTISPSPPEASDEELKIARDASALCHQALRLLSSIFYFPWLAMVFSTAEDLEELLGGMIEIALAEHLPTAEGLKTRTIALWSLSVQNLPAAVLERKRGELVKVLVMYIPSGPVPVGEEVLLADALKVVSNVLQRYPATFLPLIHHLYPVVLHHLISRSEIVRLGAAHALGGFAAASISNFCPEAYRAELVEGICEFVDSHVPSTVLIEDHLSQRFPSLIFGGFSEEAISSIVGPCWALSILSSFIVLSDGVVFTRPRFIKFILNSAAPAVHCRSTIRKLHSQVWSCLVWAMMRLRLRRDQDISSVNATIPDKALLVLKQGLNNGIGPSLVYCILGDGRLGVQRSLPMSSSGPSDLSLALDLIRDMVMESSAQLHANVVSLLSKMTSGIGASSSTETRNDEPWDIRNVLEPTLFDGTILRVDPSDPQWLPVTTFAPSSVRCLSEEEIVRHWDGILDIWLLAIKRAVQAKTLLSVSDGLLSIWHALLLVQTHLTQNNGHLTSPPEFADRTVTILSKILSWHSGGEGDDEPLHLARLHTTYQLWTVIKNVFVANWLSQTAGSILDVVLKMSFSLGSEEVKTAWGHLCSDLAVLSKPELLPTLLVASDHRSTSARRQAWSILAETWLSSMSQFSWEQLASFLSIPMRAWSPSQYENELWTSLFRNTLTVAGRESVPINIVIEKMMEYPFTVSPRTSEMTKILVTYIEADHPAGISLSLLSRIDVILSTSYPQAELLYPTLDIIQELTKIVKTCRASVLEELLLNLSNSLCTWIRDESEMLLDEEYNDVIMPLYTGSLDRLRLVKPSVSSLHRLEPFFCSTFHRMPPPALGPVAFKSFWDFLRDQIGPEGLKKSCPDKIRTCLTAFYDACGGGLPLELVSESQIQDYSDISNGFVPDSQPPVDPLVYGFPPSLGGSEIRDESRSFEAINRGDPRSARTDVQKPHGMEIQPDSARPSSPSKRPSPEGSYCKDNDDASMSAVGGPLLSPEVPLLGLAESLTTSKDVELPVSTAIQLVDIQDASFSIQTPSSPLMAKSNVKGKHKKRLWDDEDGPGSQRNSCYDRDKRFRSRRGSLSWDLPRGRSPESLSRSQQTVDLNTGTDRLYEQSRIETSAPHVTQLSYEVPYEPLSTKVREESPDDFDTWEETVATPEVLRLRKELTSDIYGPDGVVDTDVIESSPVRDTRSMVGGHTTTNNLSPEVPYAGFNPHRSQSAPVNPTQPRPHLLRRAETTSMRLRALENAYDAVREGREDMPMQEIAAATRLVHQIQGFLSERLLFGMEPGANKDDGS